MSGDMDVGDGRLGFRRLHLRRRSVKTPVLLDLFPVPVPPTLPDDIIIEILLRLSVKKLAKFRCVCKQWRAIISFDPCFRRLYLRRSEENPLLLVAWSSKNENYASSAIKMNPQIKHLTSIDIKHGTIQEEITLPEEVGDDITDIIVHSSACSDLICLVGLFHVYVYNLTTGKLMITLPPPRHRDYFVNVAFGRVPSSKEYKFFSFITNQFFGETTCEILTLSGGRTAAATASYQWRDVEEPPYALSHCRAPFINGVIYLIADLEFYDHEEEGEDLMVAFHIDRETFQVFSPPACYSDPRHVGSRTLLFELEGSLCLADVGDPGATQLDLWLLKEGNNESRMWVKQCSIDLSTTQYAPYMNSIRSITVVDGKILMNMPWKRLVYYDPQSKKFSDFEINMPNSFYGCSYVQNFLSLGGI